jgi:hypothetical protein
MQKTWQVVVVLFLLLSMAACSSTSPPVQAGEVVIPFEEVSMSVDGSAYEGQEPKLLLATTLEELAEIKALASSAPVPEIEQVALSKYAVIALFRGVQPSTNYKVVVETILSNNDILIIRAQYWEPDPNIESATVETSPYHIVKVRQDKLATKAMKLKLQTYPIH